MAEEKGRRNDLKIGVAIWRPKAHLKIYALFIFCWGWGEHFV